MMLLHYCWLVLIFNSRSFIVFIHAWWFQCDCSFHSKNRILFVDNFGWKWFGVVARCWWLQYMQMASIIIPKPSEFTSVLSVCSLFAFAPLRCLLCLPMSLLIMISFQKPRNQCWTAVKALQGKSSDNCSYKQAWQDVSQDIFSIPEGDWQVNQPKVPVFQCWKA